jgi:CubicO group peptidase (beta-lactamase class C family)
MSQIVGGVPYNAVMSVTRGELQQAADVLADGIEHGDAPGAVARVLWRGKVVLDEALGWAEVEPDRREMQLDSIFDLASLTKPLAATPVLLQLIERGEMELGRPIRDYLPELRDRAVGGASIFQLMTHTSGIRAHMKLYLQARDREAVVRAIGDLGLDHQPGTLVEYTCLGFILLGIAAERVTGEPLDSLANRMVFKPLGLRDTGYLLDRPGDRFAATENGNGYERAGLDGESGFSDWRAGYAPGTVHDGNAYYAMGGVSANAGLFGTTGDVARLGQMWLAGGELDGARILSPESVQLATLNLTPSLNLARGLGWQIVTPGATDDNGHWSSGTRFSPRTYGHTGFTGTSIWIDPDDEIVAVLLTNRVHPRIEDDGTKVISLRHRFHNAVARALKSM